MPADIGISVNATSVGTLTFDEAPRELTAKRTGVGFSLDIPTKIRLRLDGPDEPMPLLDAIRVTVSAPGPGGQPEFELGVATDSRFYEGAQGDMSIDGSLTWSGPLAALAQFEKLRDPNAAPRLSMTLRAAACWLIRQPPTPEVVEQGVDLRSRLRTAPHSIYGTTLVTYPKETWNRMIRKLGVAETVFLEIPLPASPPSPWDKVWAHFVDARNYFEQGGETGWKASVAAAREALSEWQKIEKEDHGPGWVAPKPPERESRTKKQRLDALRWHLLQCAHLAPHTPAPEWTRDDAVLALTALAALLAHRKP